MRPLFKIFALLDFISLVFLGMQLWQIAKVFASFTMLSDKVNGILMFPVFLLVLIGAVGLFIFKKWGGVLYYIQFPFRLYLWVFTFGFITLLPEAFGDYGDVWPSALLKVCFAGEILRLYLTIRAHKVFR